MLIMLLNYKSLYKKDLILSYLDVLYPGLSESRVI
jgi:hypothetical protein